MIMATPPQEHVSNVLRDVEMLGSHFGRCQSTLPDILVDPCLPTECMRKRLATFFSRSATLHILCWLGHGDAEGNWILGDGVLTLNELSSIWGNKAQRQHESHLFILSDCCFSGAWVQQASTQRLPTISIQASCSERERLYDGAFIPLWLQYIHGRYPVAHVLDSFSRLKITPRAYHKGCYQLLSPSINPLLRYLFDTSSKCDCDRVFDGVTNAVKRGVSDGVYRVGRSAVRNTWPVLVVASIATHVLSWILVLILTVVAICLCLLLDWKQFGVAWKAFTPQSIAQTFVDAFVEMKPRKHSAA